MSRRLALLATLVLACPSATVAEEPIRPGPNSAEEPLGAYSLKRGAEFLDAVSVDWTKQRKCGTCHTNYAHVMAGPVAGMSPALQQVRAYFEGRVAGWDNGEKGAKPIGEGEAVATATALAFYDAATTGQLHPATRAALDRMWTVQRPDGAWNWFDCDLPPMEDDDYYGIVLAAVAVGHAPGDYKSSETAQPGIERLRGYLAAHPAPDLHHRTMLLWASTGLDGLVNQAEQQKTIADLLSKQRPDGGWSLNSLGQFERRDGTPNTEDSDGYGTGFVLYVLRQTGMPADAEPIRRGVAWLKANQRISGRWFTRSPSVNDRHYITHAGTAYALMALKACGEK